MQFKAADKNRGFFDSIGHARLFGLDRE